MNDLHDDPQLRHIDSNKINVLPDKSLDLASELCHGGNREWYDRNDNINTINDKIDLVNEIGEVNNSFMTNAYNIIDAINKSCNNDSLYDILEEDLEKCKDTILKTNKILRKMTLMMSMYVKNKILRKMTLILSMYVKNRILIKMKQVLMKMMMMTMIMIVRLMMMMIAMMMMILRLIMIARLMMMIMIMLIKIFLV